jgi:hypothetical protein
MNIDPRVGAWCNFIAIVLAGIGAGSVAFGNLSAGIVSDIKTAAGDGLFLLTCANLVFHLYSAPAPGPAAKGN